MCYETVALPDKSVSFFSVFYLPKGTRILLSGVPGVPLMLLWDIKFSSRRTTTSRSIASWSVLCVKCNKMRSACMVPSSLLRQTRHHVHVQPLLSCITLPLKQALATDVCYLFFTRPALTPLFLERTPSFSCVVQSFPALSPYL